MGRKYFFSNHAFLIEMFDAELRIIGDFQFLVVFSSFEKTTYCCRARRLSVSLSSVEIIYFRDNSLSNKPIDLKFGLNVREGVVHVRKA